MLATVEYEKPSVAARLGRQIALISPPNSWRLLTEGFDDTLPAWSPDGQAIVFIRGRRRMSAADWRYARQLETTPQSVRDPERAQRFLHDSLQSDVWSVSLTGAATRLSSSSAQFTLPQFCADGRIAVAEADSRLWIRGIAGPQASERLVPLPHGAICSYLTPNPHGDEVAAIALDAFDGRAPLRHHLYLLDTATSRWREPYPQLEPKLAVLQWLTDPSRVSIAQRGRKGPLTYWHLSTKDAAPQMIVTPFAVDRAGSGTWSADGKALAVCDYPSPETGRLLLWRLGTVSPTLLYAGRRPSWPTIAPNGDKVAVVEDQTQVRFVQAERLKADGRSAGRIQMVILATE